MLHCRVYGQAANAAGMSITSRSRSANRVQIQVEIQNETASDFKCSLAQSCRHSIPSDGTINLVPFASCLVRFKILITVKRIGKSIIRWLQPLSKLFVKVNSHSPPPLPPTLFSPHDKYLYLEIKYIVWGCAHLYWQRKLKDRVKFLKVYIERPTWMWT